MASGSGSRAASLTLLCRATFGLTPGLVADARGKTGRQWLDAQLRPGAIPDLTVEQLRRRYPVLSLSTADVVSKAKAEGRPGNWDQMRALNETSVGRAIWGRRQLLERMVDFWSNLLAVTSPSDNVWATRADYEATALRPNALGSYRALLRGAIHHPAMLMYLNNDISSKTKPNENLGRELLELHTVGVGAGYSETDVLNSARILTGLSRDWTTQAYVYRPSWHYAGPVSVLGFRDPNPSSDGQAVVVAYLDYLARHPATATRICRTLCEYFVADTPPAALVTRMAAVYTRNDTAIPPVLREMFLSPEFEAGADKKIRRPAEQVYAAMRTLGVWPDKGAGTKGIEWLRWSIGSMANEPNAWPTPDGYPTSAEEWRSAGAMLTRFNVVMTLAQGWQKDLTYVPITNLLPRPLPADHGGLITALHRRLHFRTMPATDVRAMCDFLGVTATTRLTASSRALNPTWDLPQLVGLLLNAPALAIY